MDHSHIDITNHLHQAALGAHIDEEALNNICDLSKYFNFSGLCTNLIRLPTARKRLGATTTKLIAVIAFPFGDIPINLKIQEAEWAANKGAEELDMVPNFFALSQGKINIFAEELAQICELDLPVRVILDVENLSKEKLSLAVEASIDAGAFGIQAGNGFGPPVQPKTIKELVNLTKGRCAIKAVGGIRTLPHAIELIEAGSIQLGTSAGGELMKELKRFKSNGV